MLSESGDNAIRVAGVVVVDAAAGVDIVEVRRVVKDCVTQPPIHRRTSRRRQRRTDTALSLYKGLCQALIPFLVAFPHLAYQFCLRTDKLTVFLHGVRHPLIAIFVIDKLLIQVF